MLKKASLDKTAMALIKFGELEHMQKLYKDGEIFLNTISYFKNLEDKKLRGDRDENITQNLQSSKIKLFINGNHVKGVSGSIKINDYQKNKFTHVFSMSALCSDAEIINPVFDGKVKEFGGEAVFIYNVKEFLSRLINASNQLIKEGILECFEADVVKYYDFGKHHGNLDSFSKSQDYSFQKEWRLCMRLFDNSSPCIIRIGNISDIAEIIKSEDFFNGKIKFD